LKEKDVLKKIEEEEEEEDEAEKPQENNY
jgi:hypothetical protein